MKVHLIIAQRKCSYPEQYAPEILDAIDEHGNDEEPLVWVSAKIHDYLYPDGAESEFDAVSYITVDIPMSEIIKRLYYPSDDVVWCKIVQ